MVASDCAVGGTLNAGDTCNLRAQFVPGSAGPKFATITLSSSAGDATVVLSGTGRPLLRIPSFSAKAKSTKKRVLKIAVTPVGGSVRSIVVQVRRNGKLLGTGSLARASHRGRAPRPRRRDRQGRRRAPARLSPWHQ